MSIKNAQKSSENIAAAQLTKINTERLSTSEKIKG